MSSLDRVVVKPALSRIFLFAFLPVFLLSKAAAACPACGDAVAAQSDTLTRSYARSITLMMSAPYLLFAGLAFFIIRSARRARK